MSESEKDTQPYPALRMAMIALLVGTLGSISSYSVWGLGFLKVFQGWGSPDVSLVYSMGLFGAFCTPLGGFLYDQVGYLPAISVGLGLVIAGFLGMAAATRTPSQSPEFIGALYLLEELGASTLWMTAAAEALRYFPKKNVGVTMGLIGLSFAASGVVYSTALSGEDMPVALCCLLIAGIVTLGTLPQFLLGSIGGNAGGGDRASRVPLEAYTDAMGSRAFGLVLAVAFGLWGPSFTLLGVLGPLGAASGLKANSLVVMGLVFSCSARIGWGFAYDYRGGGREAAVRFLLFAALLNCLSWITLYSGELHESPSVTILGACGALFASGGSMPITGAVLESRIPSPVRGGVMGLQQLMVPLANAVLLRAAGPPTLDRAASFVPLAGLSLVLALVCFSAVAANMHADYYESRRVGGEKAALVAGLSPNVRAKEP